MQTSEALKAAARQDEKTKETTSNLCRLVERDTGSTRLLDILSDGHGEAVTSGDELHLYLRIEETKKLEEKVQFLVLKKNTSCLLSFLYANHTHY